MPIPTPSGDQSEREFISECMGDANMQDEFPDEEQRAAVCHRQWREKQTMPDQSKHAQLIQAIRGRRAAGHVSRYGIGTADGIVAKALDEIGDGFCAKLAGAAGAFNRDRAIKEASGRLIAFSPQAKVEQTATVGNFKSLLPEGVELPPHTLMVMRYTLTTARKDRDGDILHPEGAEIDPAGPMLWQHLFNLPIGKMLAVTEKSAKRLREIGVLLDLNELTEDCAKLFEAGALRFSHGFQALDWRELKTAPDMKGGGAGKVGFEVLRYEILERSAVSVPSNPEAMLDLFARGKLASEVYRKQAKSLMDKRPVQVAGKAIRACDATPAVPGETAVTQPIQAKEDVDERIQRSQEQLFEDRMMPKLALVRKEPETVECPKCGGEAKRTESGQVECPECGKVEMKEEGKEEKPATPEDKSGIWVTREQMQTVCPKSADAMKTKGLQKVDIEALEPDVLRTFLQTKAGRVLSAANVNSLKECLSDLEELAGMQLPRAAGALAGRIIQRLGALVEAATPASEEPTEEKTIGSMLAQAGSAELARFRDIVQAMLTVEELDARGQEYRMLVSKCFVSQ